MSMRSALSMVRRLLSLMQAWLRPRLVSHNLLGPDLICSIAIDVLPELSRKVYCTKWTGPPQDFAKIVQSVIQAGVDLGAQHGVTISFQPQPPPQAPPQGGAHV